MTPADGERLLIVGNPEPIHVGAHLLRAAHDLGLPAMLCDSRQAYDGLWPVRKWNWWLRGRRPSRLRAFSRQVVQAAEAFGPTAVLTTGQAPLDAAALEALGKRGVRRLNYLTDDPWNPNHHAPWFLDALPRYDHVFSPRRSNLGDLARAGCPRVAYLPFAYAPHLHFPEPGPAPQPDPFACDVMFAGGADRDRVPYLAALVRAGFDVALYGGYWERYAATCAHARGHLDGPALRRATRGARVVLCLVRRANRDGHVMRTFEAPTMGACLLAEHTAEHEEILGPDGEAVVYFRTIPEMVDRLRWLLAHDAERSRLAERGRRRIVEGANTYQDRLRVLLALSHKDVRKAAISDPVAAEAS
jgi:hypothetical protein